MCFSLYIDVDLYFMQFYYHFLVDQRPLKCYVIYNGFNLTVFDGLSNDNKII
jgi:hypothetical protein